MLFRLARPALPSWLTWPGHCALCAQWGPHAVCEACITDWRRPCPRCPRCALPQAAHPGAACPDCDIRQPEFDRAVAAVHYTPPWSTLIARLKFQGQTSLAKPLGQVLAQAVTGHAGQMRCLPDVVLPVPLSRERLRERGYNQAWLLARVCAQRLGCPARHDVLHRVQHTDRLMGMGAEARGRALQEAFAVNAAQLHWVEGAHVALVDDVLTTGATADAASAALRRAGAKSVSVWTVARTTLRP